MSRTGRPTWPASRWACGGAGLADLDGWEPVRVAAARLEELRLDAEELRVEATVRAGRFRDVLADTQARVTEQPLREHRWTLLALAQYQAGREGDALRTLRSSSHVPAEGSCTTARRHR